jgi:hypothetical protein
MLIRIIDALSSRANNDILISGSVGITGSFGINSGSISETSDANFLLAYDTGSGNVTFSGRATTSGTSGTSGLVVIWNIWFFRYFRYIWYIW